MEGPHKSFTLGSHIIFIIVVKLLADILFAVLSRKAAVDLKMNKMKDFWKLSVKDFG